MSDSNWPPLEINGTRIRASWAWGFESPDSTAINVSMPAFAHRKNGGCGFGLLLGCMHSGIPLTVLCSKAIPNPPGRPAPMCGGRFADPQGYNARLTCIDLLATAGNRIDLELSFAVDTKLASCKYESSSSDVPRILTWQDFYMELGGQRAHDDIYEVQLRMTPDRVTTGYFATRGQYAEDVYYDIDEQGARIAVDNLVIK